LGEENASAYVKDAFHEYLIAGKEGSVNPTKSGTKAAAHYVLEVPAGGVKVVRLRFSAEAAGACYSRTLGQHFLRGRNGKRPVYGGSKKFQEDLCWKDYILFYECFHGDNGAGLGASHQTGWTGVIARSLDLFARLTPEVLLEVTKNDVIARMTREQVAGGGAASRRCSGKAASVPVNFCGGNPSFSRG
jgi:hypothetical protein